MILNFSVSNWMSFRDKAELSMIATDFDDHSERLTVLRNYGAKVLPISIIFGGNASGKSNFINALHFAKNFVVVGYGASEEIGVEQFLLNPDCPKMETRFEFRILVASKVYEFSFSLNRSRITKEKLVEVNEDIYDILYERENDEITIGENIAKNRNIEDSDLLRFLVRSTRKNQLFLSNSIEQNFDLFRTIYEWFERISIIYPDTAFGQYHFYFDKANAVTKNLNEVIQKLDVGIHSIEGVDIPIDSVSMPDDEIGRLKKELKEGTSTIVNNMGNKILVTRDNGNLLAQKLVANHKSSDSSDVKFEFRLESEGTKRLFDLLPVFFVMTAINKMIALGKKPDLDDWGKVLVIDELDRSLHSIAVQRLLDSYLEACGEDARTQLILTSHNVEVMDRKLIRPDEIWVAEKQLDGASKFQSLSEYKDSRSDDDFRNSYLLGKFGGIPHIQFGGLFDSNEGSLSV